MAELTPQEIEGAARLRKYWSQTPEGRAQWMAAPHKFETLRKLLRSKGVPGRMVDGLTAKIYHEALGVWPGQKKD